MDKIYIRELAARCIIGLNDWEREARQDVVMDITLSVDLSKPAQTDKLEDTVNYRAIKKRILIEVEASRFHLLEALAGHIASLCLEFDGVEQVTVTVDKPGALRFARSVAVEVTRRKGKD